MSGGTSCKEHPKTEWFVAHREHNHSAFEGYRMTRSAYSEVKCTVCRKRWRTTAGYVDELPGGCSEDPPPR